MSFIQTGRISGLDKSNIRFEKGGALFEKEPEKESHLFAASACHFVTVCLWIPVV